MRKVENDVLIGRQQEGRRVNVKAQRRATGVPGGSKDAGSCRINKANAKKNVGVRTRKADPAAATAPAGVVYSGARINRISALVEARQARPGCHSVHHGARRRQTRVDESGPVPVPGN